MVYLRFLVIEFKNMEIKVKAIFILFFISSPLRAGAYLPEIESLSSSIIQEMDSQREGTLEEKLSRVKEMSWNYGMWEAPLPAYTVLQIFQKATKNSKKDTGLIKDAVEMCGRCPEIYYLAVKVSMNHGFSALPQAMEFFFKGVWFNFLNSLERFFFTGIIFKWLHISILASLLFVLFFSLIFNLPQLSHFLKDWMRVRTGSFFVFIFLIVLSLLPIIIGFGLDISAFFLLASLIIWIPPSRRSFIILSSVFLLLIPVFYYLRETGEEYLSDKRVKIAWKYENYIWDEELLNEIKSMEDEEPSLKRMRGLILLKLGRTSEAMSIFQSLVSQRELDSRDLINLGISKIGEGMEEEAVEAFRKASNSGDTACSAHYNLSQYYYRKALVFEAEKEHQIAKELCSAKVGFMTKVFNKSYLPRSFIIEEDTGFSYSRIFLEKARKKLKLTLFPRPPFSSGLFLNLLCFLILLLAIRVIGENFETVPIVSRCNNCGVSFCHNCLEVGSEEEGFCNTCYSIFIRKISGDIDMRRKKEIEVRRYKNFVSSFEKWTALIPGLSHTFQGRLNSAFLYLTFILFGIIFLLYPSQAGFHLVPHSLPVPPLTILAGLLVFTLYIISAVSSLKGGI